MAEKTEIAWTDSTFNPWIGCTKVGPGCDNCYAEALMDKRYHKVHWGTGQQRQRTSASNWKAPLHWEKQHEAFAKTYGRRRRVFCASLADVFDNEVPPAWRRDLFELIDQTPHLDWLLLTKRIGNVRSLMPRMIGGHADGGPYFRNVWLGITVVNQEEADRDIPKLLAVPARVRFLSIEPMLGPINLRWHLWKCCGNPIPGHGGDGWMQPPDPPECCGDRESTDLHWVIVGGESGHGARPMHPDWARSLRDQCEAASVPFLFKQWGEWGPTTLEASRHLGFMSAPLRGDDIAFTAFGPAGRQVAIPVVKAGKKSAGRLLDGVQHDEFPIAGPR